MEADDHREIDRIFECGETAARRLELATGVRFLCVSKRPEHQIRILESAEDEALSDAVAASVGSPACAAFVEIA